MAYTTPPTFTTGNVLTAAQMNTNVRDNPNFLHDPPGCMISRATNQTIASSAVSATITLGAVIYDTDSMTGTANKITISTAGVYHFSFQCEWAAQAGGSRAATITNPTGIAVATTLVSPAGTSAATSCGGDYVCTAAQVFTADVWQNSGSSVAILGTGTSSIINSVSSAALNFSAHWVGAG